MFKDDWHFICNVATLSTGEEDVALRKELNVMEKKGVPMYMLGFFKVESDNKRTPIGDVVILSEREYSILYGGIFTAKEKAEEAIDKFKRDYIQQAHNGKQVIKEKDK